jgi:hypothetical protein
MVDSWAKGNSTARTFGYNKALSIIGTCKKGSDKQEIYYGIDSYMLKSMKNQSAGGAAHR